MKAMKMKSLVLFFCLILASATAAWAADGATFVSETYTDGTSVTGGTSFIKTWTIRNSGTTKWTSGYKLRYVSGNLSTNHSDIPISGTVSPGSSYKFSVTMKAPAAQSSAKSYREDWKFVNSSGTTIKVSGSSTIWASIKVPGVQLTDKASWGSETIPDNTKVTGGSSFNKTWTIKNSGTSTWTSSYKLQYVSNQGGRLSSISEVRISGTVYPGGSYTFTVPMKAPAAQSSEKSYREDWKFVSPSGGTINIGSSSTIWASIKVPAVPSNTVAGWSDATGYRHAETTKQRAIVTAALSGGNGRPSPQSVIGSPWQTDTAGDDGGRMRLAIQDVYNYWVANRKPSLPLATIPATVQSSMRNRLAATYPLAQQNAFVERIRRVFNGTVPTTDDATLTYLGIRAQCKEFADRMVQAGGGTKRSYGYTAVAKTNIRPGMYAFKNGNTHATIVVAVNWDATGQPTQLRLAESNWGTGWSNPLGQIPWERIVTTGRVAPVSDYYVVATE